MDITLEMIDQVRERTGSTYQEAINALENTGGSVVDALDYLENKPHNNPGIALKEKIKKAYQDCQDARLEIKIEDRNLMDIPLTWGALGAVFFPKWTAWGVMGLLLSRGTLQVKKASEKNKQQN